MEVAGVENAVQELMTFDVGSILCGVWITQVQEINQNWEITPVHHAPDYVKGVLNLRGHIVTVIDLRQKFSYPIVDLHPEMRIVVVRCDEENIGLLVDCVQDVISVDMSCIDAPPSNMSGINGAFFSGVYTTTNGLVAIVDIEAVIRL